MTPSHQVRGVQIFCQRSSPIIIELRLGGQSPRRAEHSSKTSPAEKPSFRASVHMRAGVDHVAHDCLSPILETPPEAKIAQHGYRASIFG